MFDLAKFENKIALFENGWGISYKELNAKREEFARRFNEKCEYKSLCLAVCAKNVDFVSGYLGLWESNCAIMLTNELHLEKICEIYKPEFIFTNAKINSYEMVFLWGEFKLYKKNQKKKNINCKLLLSTSGSTGSAKFVRFNENQIRKNTEQILDYMKLNSKDSAISLLPFEYSFGLSVLHTILVSGGSMILGEFSLMQREFWDVIKEHKISIFAGVPSHYEQFFAIRGAKKEIFFRIFLQAGGKLSQNLQIEFSNLAKKLNAEFFISYGQTEASPRIAYLPDSSVLNAIGVAVSGGELWLENIENEAGELCYRGENVALGYAENADDLAKEDEFGGILRTGDLAKIDKNGFFHIVGRISRFCKIFGKRINLDELQNAINTRFEANFVALSDDCQIFILSDNFVGDLSLVVKFSAEFCGVYFGAFVAKMIKKIPENERGKVNFVELKKHIKKENL